MHKIKVNLAERSYDLVIGINTIANLGTLAKNLKLGSKVLVITDPVVKRFYGHLVEESFKHSGFKVFITTIPQGEKSKNIKTAISLYKTLAELKLRRDDTIVGLGGGVIGDIAGFVAGTYMRGMNLIHVPTTLLAQVDSSIGGKTGVDLSSGKNLVGVFYQPKVVVIDLQTLRTLPAKEITNGLAEIIKYGVIRSNTLFYKLENNKRILTPAVLRNIQKNYGTFALWETIITECCHIKASVVAEDEKEGGLRMILNFGHTIGHAIETATRYKAYSHGEAIAIGMVAASALSFKMEITEEKDALKVGSLIRALGLPTQLKKPLPKEKLKALLGLDKKIRGGKTQFVLLKRIGEVIIASDIPLQVLDSVLEGIGCK